MITQDNLDELIAFNNDQDVGLAALTDLVDRCLVSWSYLIRSCHGDDDPDGYFANITSPNFQCFIDIGNKGATSSHGGLRFPVYADSAEKALRVSISQVIEYLIELRAPKSHPRVSDTKNFDVV